LCYTGRWVWNVLPKTCQFHCIWLRHVVIFSLDVCWRTYICVIETAAYSFLSLGAKCKFFTALHGLAIRKVSVCLSVHPSVKRVGYHKTEERSVQILIPYERLFSLVFWEEEWLVWGHPFYLKFWVNEPPLESNHRFWTDTRWSSYVVPKPPKGGSKTQNGCFWCKIALRLKKVCYRVSLCENCQWQSCKAFIGLTVRAKMVMMMIGGGDAFYLKFWVKVTALERNRRFSISSLVATQP